MLKTPHKSFFLVVAALLTLLCSTAQDAAEDSTQKIIFLQLRTDANGVTLLKVQAQPGYLKPQSRSGALEIEATEPTGTIVYNAQVDDPRFQRLEYPHASAAGVLQTETVTRDSAEFTLRVPARAAGGTLKLFQRATIDNGRLKALATRELLGEIAIPEVPSGLQAFAASAKLFTLLTNGPTSSRLNIAILAEGFTAGEESTFTNRAHSVLNQFLSASPYSEYRNHFNGFAIFVPSAESGSDHPTTRVFRNTYFNSSYGEGGLVRLITIPPNPFNSNYSDGVGKVNALLAQFMPEHDIALLLVNDSEYGGSGGFPAIASINVSSAELALHEIGHSFADLADEYETETPGFPEVEKANTTRDFRRDSIKWRGWISPLTPIPTPETSTYASVVGLFEGAYFHANDWYRPKLDCRMRTLGREFCEVCKEAIVLSAYSRLEIIHGSSPSENNVTVPGGGELLLSVDTANPVQTPLAFTWTVDGTTNFLYDGPSFPASFATLGTGTRLVRASVTDPTPLVRNDPFGKLWKTRSWLVQVTGESNLPPTISAISNLQIPARPTVAPVPFTISDPDTPIDMLMISAEASDTNLFADLRISGSGTNRLLEINPHCDRPGTSTISIIVSDGNNGVSTSFSVTVTAVLSHVYIESVPDLQVFDDVLRIRVRTHHDSCVEPMLVLSSRNTDVLPDANITIEKGETDVFLRTDWWLRLERLSGQNGSVQIALKGTPDEPLWSQFFTVTFLPRPTAIALPPERKPEGLLLRFTCEPAAPLVLEYSSDFRSWHTVDSSPSTTSMEYLLPANTLGPQGFFRVRLVPL